MKTYIDTSTDFTHTLQTDAWLQTLPDAVRQQIIIGAQIKTVTGDTVIFSQGDKPKAYYGLLAGSARISTFTYDGRETQLTRLSAPHWFGEMSFLDGNVRTHTASSIGTATLAIIPASHVRQLLKQYPALYEAFVQQLCRHTRQLYAAADNFLLMTPEGLLAQRVLELLDVADQRQGIHCSQDELARLVGVSRQSINRTLCIWEKKGFVKRGYRQLRVLDAAALQAVQAVD